MKEKLMEYQRAGIQIEPSSFIEGIPSWDWVRENHPENGVFRVYWIGTQSPTGSIVTFDPEEGEGLKYEWYYKDGKRVDGVSKGWYPNGNLKQIQTWKDGKLNGLYIMWYPNKQKQSQSTFKDGEEYGLWTEWRENGQKKFEGNNIGRNKNYNPIRDGLWTFWDEDGQKVKEVTYKDGEIVNEYTR